MIKPISLTERGEIIAIQYLGCNDDEIYQLQELGCIEGVHGKIISNHSNIIFQLGGTRLAISGKLAETIIVSSR